MNAYFHWRAGLFLNMGKFHVAVILSVILLFEEITQLCLCSNTSFGCIEREREALLKFKHSLEDPSNRLSSWEGSDCCKWQGVSCSISAGHVIKLDLQNTDTYTATGMARHLVAPQVHSSLLKLKYLNYLDLSGNDFQGSTISKFLGSIQRLRYLNLSNAYFTGMVPHQLGNLSNLCILDLHDGSYQILSEGLTWISRLVSLRYLDMSGSYFGGSQNLMQLLNMFPSSLLVLHLSWCVGLSNTHQAKVNSTHFPFIQVLDLSGNFFENSFPYILQNMTSLRVIDLSQNSFNSSIPLWLGEMKNLVHLNLAENMFRTVEGGFSNILWNQCQLKSLDLSYNSDIFQNQTLETNRNLSRCITYDLEALIIVSTELTGCLPYLGDQFKKLKHLNLQYNSLHGPIPSSIGSLPALIELDLSRNQLTGVIPTTLGNLSSLRELCLSHNHLNGVIPATLGNLSSLRELDLSENQLTGVIPSTLGNFSSLRELDLSENQLMGVIPTTLGNLSSLRKLDISHNHLNGVIPNSIGHLLNLEILLLSSNSLEGVISEFHFSNLSKLEELSTSFNHLTVKLKPDWVPPFQLKYIEMRSCKIGTQFPEWLKMQKEIIKLDLSNASISGSFSLNVTDAFPTIQSLLLSDNLINGTIPNSLCQMGSLETLDLSNNMLSGDIPNCWREFQNLHVMKLSSNKLTGVIPGSIGNLSSLGWLHLNNNSFGGELPLSLRNCTTLLVLNLGENRFSGNIPAWIGEGLPFLQILRLRNNMFDGHIPLQLCQLSSLQILDLADNSLTGSISNCFGNLSGMVKASYNRPNYGEWLEENIVVVMKGRGLEYTTMLRLVVNMDLSNNNLVSMIPEELTLLSGLIGLNLSHNHLTGSIPKTVGKMASLESLDFSSNQLSGNIPMSMSHIPSLSYLNLSHNNFSGKIPTGQQLQTLVDPSIYAGNPELCGDPLLKRCPGDDPAQVPIPTTDEENDEEDNKSDKVLFYIAVMLGYGTGLWAVIGILVFKKNWRYAYFRFADETKDWIYVAIAVNATRLKKKIMKIRGMWCAIIGTPPLCSKCSGIFPRIMFLVCT